MELELGIKITHTRDDTITSTADFRISKDPFGPVFLSRETDKMFLLIAHLKGFRRENIHIEINKSGNRITIRGEKPVQEMVLMGLIMYKKEVEIRAFRKAFKLPDVVDLDRIKARYNEEQSTLTITMRKKFRGIIGLEIEEEKEEAETSMAETIDNKESGQGSAEIQEEIPEEEKVDKGEPEDKLVEEESHEEQPKAGAGDEINGVLPTKPTEEKSKAKEMEDEVDNEEPQAIQNPSEEGTSEKPEEIAAFPIEELKVKRDNEQPQTNRLASTQEALGEEHHDQSEEVSDITEPGTDAKKQEADLVPEETQKQMEEEMEEIGNTIEDTDSSLEPHQENETNQGLPARAEEIKGSSEQKKKKSKLCPPFWFAGSALLVSLIVIVIHLIRAKKD